MKTKIFRLIEWQNLCDLGEGYEDMLTNGNPKLIAIECESPKCKAKVWDKTLGDKIRKIRCDVCHWEGWRRVGKKR